MLFDLSGKRRNVVRVVYAVLALLMGGSLVLFGIGSDAPGGILDAFGIGGGDTSRSTDYDEQIEEAEDALEADPEDERAMLDLVRYHYLAASESGITSDPTTGQTTIEEGARGELEETVAAWESYLATDPRKPDAGTAANAAQAYVYLQDADGAASAQEIVAESQNSAPAYAQLALYLYADGQLKAGDAAGEKAIEAADASERAQVKKIVEGYAEQARKAQKQLEKQREQGAGEAPQVEDPFGGLGGTPPPVPAPAP